MDPRTAAHALSRIAAYLELRGERRFKSKAYEQAALLDRFDFVADNVLNARSAGDVLAFARARRMRSR